MRTLSVREPWATLIVHGIKDIENRSRGTSHRGPLLIHASRTWDARGRAAWAVGRNGDTRIRLPTGDLIVPGTGRVIGAVDVTDVLPPDAPCVSEWAVPGHWHWVLASARWYRVRIPATGQAGFFHLPSPPAEWAVPVQLTIEGDVR